MGGSFNVMYHVCVITYFLFTHFTYPTTISSFNSQLPIPWQPGSHLGPLNKKVIKVVYKVHDCVEILIFDSPHIE